MKRKKEKTYDCPRDAVDVSWGVFSPSRPSIVVPGRQRAFKSHRPASDHPAMVGAEGGLEPKIETEVSIEQDKRNIPEPK